MPPKAKVTRQMILDAAFAIVREQGHEQINARSIADKLGCSTQPIMYNFKTIEEIRTETYRMVDEYHSRFILPKGDGNPLLELGLNYIRFGQEEKHFFRFLFQTNRFSGFTMEALMADPALSELIGIVSAQMGSGEDKAREVLFSLFACAHGLAALLANNAMAYDEEFLKSVLRTTFLGMMRG